MNYKQCLCLPWQVPFGEGDLVSLTLNHMSKAFTRESDDGGAENVAPKRTQSLGGFITRDGAERLRKRLGDLVEERKVLAGRGEEDPNAKATLKRIESEVQKLESTLNSVVVADPPADREKVALGASVRVLDGAGEEETYQVVGPDEADPGHGRISAASPLAQALLNKRAGEQVRFRSPAGEQALTIVGVHY